jgi:hypothetical protein
MTLSGGNTPRREVKSNILSNTPTDLFAPLQPLQHLELEATPRTTPWALLRGERRRSRRNGGHTWGGGRSSPLGPRTAPARRPLVAAAPRLLRGDDVVRQAAATSSGRPRSKAPPLGWRGADGGRGMAETSSHPTDWVGRVVPVTKPSLLGCGGNCRCLGTKGNRPAAQKRVTTLNGLPYDAVVFGPKGLGQTPCLHPVAGRKPREWGQGVAHVCQQATPWRAWLGWPKCEHISAMCDHCEQTTRWVQWK